MQTLKGVHNGRTMHSYIQEHIVCSWKQFESAWKSIWVLRYCKKYDVLFLLFRPSLGVPVSISETRPWPVKHCDEIVITGSGPKTLNKKTGNCALILYKTNGQRAVLNAYYAPFPLSTWDAYSLWSHRQFGGQSHCCLFCFFVNQHSHPYNAVIKPNQLIITSKARDQLQVRAHWWRDARTSLSHC